MRPVYGKFREYHTSADNPRLRSSKAWSKFWSLARLQIEISGENASYGNTTSIGEPQLGRRDVFHPARGIGIGGENMAAMWVLNPNDGAYPLLNNCGAFKAAVLRDPRFGGCSLEMWIARGITMKWRSL